MPATLPDGRVPKVRLGVLADPLRWLLPKPPPIEGLLLPLPVIGRLPLFIEGLWLPLPLWFPLWLPPWFQFPLLL